MVEDEDEFYTPEKPLESSIMHSNESDQQRQEEIDALCLKMARERERELKRAAGQSDGLTARELRKLTMQHKMLDAFQNPEESAETTENNET